MSFKKVRGNKQNLRLIQGGKKETPPLTEPHNELFPKQRFCIKDGYVVSLCDETKKLAKIIYDSALIPILEQHPEMVNIACFVSDLEIRAKPLVAQNPKAKIYVELSDGQPHLEPVSTKTFDGKTGKSVVSIRIQTVSDRPNMKINGTPISAKFLFVVMPLNEEGAKLGYAPHELELI